MDPSLVMFAIDAGVRLGHKLHETLVDETAEGPLILPMGNLIGSVVRNDALDYFRVHRELTALGGPYQGLSDDERVSAYRTLMVIDQHLDLQESSFAEAREIVISLKKFEKFHDGFGTNPPLQRILGTVVEIGIDFLIAHPEQVPSGSSTRKVISAFLANLDDVEFAEGSKSEIASDILVAALRTLGESATLIDDNKRLQSIVGGISKTLIEDVESITSQGLRLKREELVRRIASSVLKGGLTAFTDDITLFLPDESKARTLVSSTLKNVLDGVRGKEDLFTNESFEILMQSALSAVHENAATLTGNVALQHFIQKAVRALTNAQGKKLFSENTVSAIVLAGLETLRDHAVSLIDPDTPEKQLLADALSAMAQGLTGTLAGGGTIKDLLTPTQVTQLASILFNEIARHPERLLGDDVDDPKKTVLAQILGSVARALGDDPGRLVMGDGFVELLQVAITVVCHNADILLNLDSTNPRTNLLFDVLKQAIAAIDPTNDTRGLVGRDVFLDIVKRILPIISANPEVILNGAPTAVKNTLAKALELATGVLENRINGANLPVLIEQLLLRVLWEELNLTEDTAVVREATAILRAA